MKFVPKTITRSVATSILRTKKSSPHIFFAAGVAGVIGGTVLACRATLKLEKTVEDVNRDINSVKEINEAKKNAVLSRYDEKEYYQELIGAYGRGVYSISKLYGPSVLISGASIAALAGSHISLTRRNAALTATIGIISKAYDDYRDRVRNELGEEHELEIYHGIENRIVSQRDGVREVAKIADPNRWSPYARFFDETSSAWEKNSEVNRVYVQCQQNYLNHLLQARGHVFLNEAYDALGIERSSAGAVMGWYLGGDGDNYIDFGIFEAYNRDFVNGNERSILLDFNVDGVIYDKI